VSNKGVTHCSRSCGLHVTALKSHTLSPLCFVIDPPRGNARPRITYNLILIVNMYLICKLYYGIGGEDACGGNISVKRHRTPSTLPTALSDP